MQLYKYTISMLILIGLFAFTFGYNEAAISYYLKVQEKNSEGQSTFLSATPEKTLKIEKLRELASLFIMIFVGMLTRGNAFRKFASFVYMFGIWDITYYVTLKRITGFPYSLFEWSILYLFPFPWMAPVIAPFIISIIGIIGAILVHFTYDIKGNLKTDKLAIFSIITSLILWLITFLFRKDIFLFPEEYNWLLFFIGIFLSLFGYYKIFKLNWLKKN